jgi:hypothetical protein
MIIFFIFTTPPSGGGRNCFFFKQKERQPVLTAPLPPSLFMGGLHHYIPSEDFAVRKSWMQGG